MEIKLSKPYVCRFEKPVIERIDNKIFIFKYFGTCLEDAFCGDKCCSFGVDIDIENVKRIESYASELEKFTDTKRENWFKKEYSADNDFVGNSHTRTQTNGKYCVFLDQINRGCLIHRFCIANSIEFHLLKPIVSCLFPLTFNDGLLHPSIEVEDNSLICLNRSMNLYRGVREDLRFYFGNDFITELDNLEFITLKSTI